MDTFYRVVAILEVSHCDVMLIWLSATLIAHESMPHDLDILKIIKKFTNINQMHIFTLDSRIINSIIIINIINFYNPLITEYKEIEMKHFCLFLPKTYLLVQEHAVVQLLREIINSTT